ncbi:Ser/Thr protein phosphatase [Magnaporthiopsis poae ATCC 64411]|uniref:Ser/Thr protein phosphatase n=1 Tax=Magnaporthiopsis poae (strain ATCC 64411 / 73-15) TaxID=644358 RepID=A0A0C4DVS3_MAGP6|nr:Ser/Thr protein phosphatase [Magnaporthiopsis poae ATCC 64411]
MTLQILSDLHLESPKGYDVFEIEPRAPYLALLGDIGTVGPHKAELLAFLTAQLRQFRAVLFVPGNHEAYHASWADALDILRDFEQLVRADASLGDFVLLDRAVFRPDAAGGSVVVLGCSLFSAVPAGSADVVGYRLNDFYHTGGGWDVASHNEAHARDLQWLNAQVAALENGPTVESIMVLTHWSPTRDPRAADPRHAGSDITSAFATDLSGEDCFQSAKVKVWAFGHTHWNCDFTAERNGACPLRLVTNQRGYYFSQAQGFDANKTINTSSSGGPESSGRVA